MQIITFLIILFSGCLCIDDSNENSRIVWESELNVGLNSGNNLPPLFYKDNVIVSRFDFFGEHSAMVCFDKKTGVKKWEWSETYLNSDGKKIKVEINKAIIFNDIIIGHDYNRMYGIDASNGKTIWNVEFDSQISDRFYLFENNIYCMSQAFYTLKKLVYYILDPNDGTFNILYEVPAYEEGYDIVSGPFRIFNNQAGEKCLLLGVAHNKDLYTPEEKWKYGMMCYNLEKEEIVFKQSYPFEVGLSNLYIHDDRIFSTGNYFSEYELSTGKLIKQFKQDQSTIDLTTLYDYPYAYLMYNNTTNRLVKVNMITGKEVGRLSLDGHQSYFMIKRDNQIFLSGRDGKIYIVNAESFNITEKIIAPHYDENSYYVFDEYFAFDDETGYFYCTDFKHLICYDLDI